MSRQREASEGVTATQPAPTDAASDGMGWVGMVLEILYCILLRIRTPPHSGHELLTR
jgi:hypothetical protein